MTKRTETWSPFQSPEVAEICAHMTDAEVSAARWRSAFYGLWVAATFVFPVVLVLPAAFLVDVPSIYPIIAAILLFALHIGAIPIWLKKQKHFLCSSAWAREHDIKPKLLRLFYFGDR